MLTTINNYFGKIKLHAHLQCNKEYFWKRITLIKLNVHHSQLNCEMNNKTISTSQNCLLKSSDVSKASMLSLSSCTN